MLLLLVPLSDSRRKSLNLPNLVLSDHDIQELCLTKIDQMLQRYSKSLADFSGLPIPPQCSSTSLQNRMIAQEMSYLDDQVSSEFERLHQMLNMQQAEAFIQISDSINRDLGKCFFVDGFGGTGKTFLWRVLCARLRLDKKIVLCVASSGIAALLMDGGRTAHSRFQIPIDCDSRSTCHIDQGSELSELIQQASLIIWDEAPMSHKHSIEAVDKTLRDILRVRYEDSENKTFGGITMVFGGDFRQTLPIIVKGTRTQIVNSSIKRSYLWESMIVLKLTQNMRLAQSNSLDNDNGEIASFSQWILDIGDGIHSNIFGESIISIPPDIVVPRSTNPISDIVSTIYADLDSTHINATYLSDRAILAPHHDTVDSINHYVLGIFPGEEVSYFSSDSIEFDLTRSQNMEGDYSVEFLNTLKVGNFPEHELKLKIGCPIILLRNMDQSTGLCNGTRMIVKRLGQWFLEVEILTGTHIGETIFLPRLTLSTHYKSLNFTLLRRQFPVTLCYAMTINKSQGQTLKNVGICLQKQVFSHGQLYVAISRVTTRKGLKILSCDSDGRELSTMQNIVFQEIFD